jgi:hypothetical protein
MIGVRVGACTDPTYPPPTISGFEEYGFPWAMNVVALPMPGGITTSGGYPVQHTRPVSFDCLPQSRLKRIELQNAVAAS